MVFFTDLDNTILYSHRHMISDPVVWVEKLNGRDQSFISDRTFNYYQKQNWLKIIPVTTRTLQQYRRLQTVLRKLGWNEALICNGAIRIVDGCEDYEWTKESLCISESSRIPFRQAYQAAIDHWGASSVVLNDPFMFYIKSENADDTYNVISENANTEFVAVYKDSRKVYCIPKVLNKGTAIERYKNRFGVELCIAAGDSAFDIPMLKLADFCICPEGMQDFSVSGKKIICRDLFSEQICYELEKIKEGSSLL